MYISRRSVEPGARIFCTYYRGFSSRFAELIVNSLPLAGTHRFFSGVGKVGPMMRWLQAHASISFNLPVLPHLADEDKPLFREQVKKRQQLQGEKN